MKTTLSAPGKNYSDKKTKEDEKVKTIPSSTLSPSLENGILRYLQNGNSTSLALNLEDRKKLCKSIKEYITQKDFFLRYSIIKDDMELKSCKVYNKQASVKSNNGLWFSCSIAQKMCQNIQKFHTLEGKDGPEKIETLYAQVDAIIEVLKLAL